MKKSRPTFLKRQREQKKTEKAAIKREKRLERRRKDEPGGEPGSPSEESDPEGTALDEGESP